LQVVNSISSRNSLVISTEIVDCQGIARYELIPEGKPVSKQMQFVALRMGSEEEAQKNGGPAAGRSHSQQCSSTPASFGRGFLSKEESDITGASHMLS